MGSVAMAENDPESARGWGWQGSSYPDWRLELFETLPPSLEVEMSSLKCAQAQVRTTRWVIKSFLRAK